MKRREFVKTLIAIPAISIVSPRSVFSGKGEPVSEERPPRKPAGFLPLCLPFEIKHRTRKDAEEK